jgi:hypothetical protein
LERSGRKGWENKERTYFFSLSEKSNLEILTLIYYGVEDYAVGNFGT